MLLAGMLAGCVRPAPHGHYLFSQHEDRRWYAAHKDTLAKIRELALGKKATSELSNKDELEELCESIGAVSAAAFHHRNYDRGVKIVLYYRAKMPGCETIHVVWVPDEGRHGYVNLETPYTRFTRLDPGWWVIYQS